MENRSVCYEKTLEISTRAHENARKGNKCNVNGGVRKIHKHLEIKMESHESNWLFKEYKSMECGMYKSLHEEKIIYQENGQGHHCPSLKIWFESHQTKMNGR